MLSEPKALAFIVTTALLEALLAMASPWAASHAIDVALPNSARSTLGLLAVAIVVANVFTAWTGWLHQRASVVLQQLLVAQTQSDLMSRYLKTGFADLQTTEFGATRVTFMGASTLASTLVGAVVDVVTQSATTLATLAILGSHDFTLAVLVFGAALLTATIAALLAIREMQFATKHMGATSQAEQLLHLLLRSVTTLRVYHATERMAARWLERCHAQAGQAIAMETTRLGRTAFLLGAQQSISLAATAWLVHQAISGTLSIGVMLSCSMLVSQTLGTILQATRSVLSVFVMRPAMRRVDALRVRSQQSAAARVAAKPCARRTAEVHVSRVWYRYAPGRHWVLQDYSQYYQSGSHTVLRAASGSGKSTLLRLIAGLILPEHGRVMVCGEDPASSAGLVAYVPQQSLLLDSSIAENLSTLSGGRLERAREIASWTGLARLLERLPMGAETLISGSGSNLSAGQRQLVTLTAALATEQPVLLLDEAVSQLDAQTRESIQWDVLCKGRTIISVQHG